jgi:hypothetical protein
MKKMILFITLFIIVASTPLYAQNIFTIGPAGSFIKSEGTVSIDSTLVFFSKGRSSGFLALPNLPVFWISGGLGSSLGGENNKGLFSYGEAGIWFLINAGAGYNFVGPESYIGPYLYFGCPVPILLVDWYNIYPFVEPYMRIGLGRRRVNEFGLMFKIAVN